MACSTNRWSRGGVANFAAMRAGSNLIWTIAAALLLSFGGPWIGSTIAQEEPPPKLQPLPEPVEPPPKVESGEVLEPEVRIFRRAGERVTEYRINGKVRAIKVQPDVGPVYYLIDHDGDGVLESRGYGPDFVVPQWVIFTW